MRRMAALYKTRSAWARVARTAGPLLELRIRNWIPASSVAKAIAPPRASIPEAFVLMHNFESTCQIQITAQSGGPLVHVNPAITAGVAAMLEADGGQVGGDFAWPAMLRKVERLDPSYKT